MSPENNGGAKIEARSPKYSQYSIRVNEESDHSGLPISELIARGWLHEF
ncbi:MAG: hypothetical protein ACKPFD_12780 [Dolichospermum sp.]